MGVGGNENTADELKSIMPSCSAKTLDQISTYLSVLLWNIAPIIVGITAILPENYCVLHFYPFFISKVSLIEASFCQLLPSISELTNN